MLFDPVTIWPCPPLIVTQVLPSWPLIVWIPKARLHWGRDPNAIQHCVMGALWPLGALQQEHVHCEIRGLSDLRSQTHELSCTLVNTHTHTHLTYLCSGVFAETDSPLLCSAWCLSSAFARGESSLCDGPTSGRCIVTSSPVLWEVSLAFAGSARMTRTYFAHLNRYANRQMISRF